MKDPIFSRINAAKVESTPHTNSERIKKGDSFSSLSFLITCNRRTTAGITAARVSMVLMDGKNKNNWVPPSKINRTTKMLEKKIK